MYYYIMNNINTPNMNNMNNINMNINNTNMNNMNNMNMNNSMNIPRNNMNMNNSMNIPRNNMNNSMNIPRNNMNNSMNIPRNNMNMKINTPVYYKNKNKYYIYFILFIVCIGLLFGFIYFILTFQDNNSATTSSTTRNINLPTNNQLNYNLNDRSSVGRSVDQNTIDKNKQIAEGTPYTFTPTVETPKIIASDVSFRLNDPTYESAPSETGSIKNMALAFIFDPFTLYGIYKTKFVSRGIQTLNKYIRIGAKAFLDFLLNNTNIEQLVRAGMAIGKAAINKAITAMGPRAAKIGAALGSRIGSMAATAGMTGPGAPLVFMAELTFTILSQGLDMGDVGGYGQMTTNNVFVDMKKMFDEDFYKTVKAKGKPDYDLPIIIGPLLEKKFLIMTATEEEKFKFIDEGFKNLFNSNHVLIRPFTEKIIEKYKAGEYTYDQIKNGTKAVNYLIDELDDKLYDKCVQEMYDIYCNTNNGKVILRKSDSEGNIDGFMHECSYINKETCEKSYTWPPTEEGSKEEEFYAEYKSKLLDGTGACVYASSSLRSVCDIYGLDYNTDDGLCRTNKEYCLMKGADWENNDCHINQGQDIAEMIFGKTIIRGLKQIFDPKQYEPCKEGEIDDVYFCRSVGCPEGHYENVGLCYPHCREGHEPFGGNLCVPKKMGLPPVRGRTFCKEKSFQTTAGMCMNECEKDFFNFGGVCYADSYGVGFGRIPDKAPCDPGQRDDWTSCWEDLHCNGYWNYTWGWGGLTRCWDGETAGWGGRGDCHRTWLINFNDCHGCGCIKKNAFQRYLCNENEELHGALCYPKCKPEYYKSTVNYCRKNGLDSYVPKSEMATCTDKENDVGGLCYEKCQPNYEMNSVGICTYKGASVYGNGAGFPAIKIRPKKRIIDFSTKDDRLG